MLASAAVAGLVHVLDMVQQCLFRCNSRGLE